jgi:hypothetical protein
VPEDPELPDEPVVPEESLLDDPLLDVPLPDDPLLELPLPEDPLLEPVPLDDPLLRGGVKGIVPPPQPTRKRPTKSKTLTLSMKIPLKPGIGIDGLIPFGQRNCRGPKKCQIFRLLNSEDLLSVSQSDPRRRACHIQTGVHVLLLR